MGISHGTERGLFARRAVRDLVQIGLAEQHSASLPEVRNDRRVAAGDMPFAYAGRGCGRHASDIDQVLDRDGHTVERTVVPACRDIAIGIGGLSNGVVGHHADKGVQPDLFCLDATQACLGNLDRSVRPCSQAASELLNRQRVKNVRHVRGQFRAGRRSAGAARQGWP